MKLFLPVASASADNIFALWVCVCVIMTKCGPCDTNCSRICHKSSSDSLCVRLSIDRFCQLESTITIKDTVMKLHRCVVRLEWRPISSVSLCCDSHEYIKLMHILYSGLLFKFLEDHTMKLLLTTDGLLIKWILIIRYPKYPTTCGQQWGVRCRIKSNFQNTDWVF